MWLYALHLLDDSRAVLPGGRIEAVPSLDMTGIVQTWQGPGDERILFVDATADNPIGWLEDAIEIEVDAPPGGPTPGELESLEAIESMAAPRRKRRCSDCKGIFRHRLEPPPPCPRA